MSVYITYLITTESLICSKALMITQTSAVNMDAESGNLFRLIKSLEHTGLLTSSY